MSYQGWAYYGRRYQDLDKESYRLRELRCLYYDRYIIDSDAGRDRAHDWLRLVRETDSKLIAIEEDMREIEEDFQNRIRRIRIK